MSEESLDPAIEALLRSPAAWEEPDPRVAKAILDEIDPTRTRRRISRWVVGAVAAALIAVVLFGVSLLGGLGADPDWTVEVVAGPEFDAWGEVSGFNEPTGTRLVLDINELPPAEPGTFYEVWWVREGGEVVSSGSFLEVDTIEMWVGIYRSDFPNMLITLEQADGDPSPSSTVVALSAS